MSHASGDARRQILADPILRRRLEQIDGSDPDHFAKMASQIDAELVDRPTPQPDPLATANWVNEPIANCDTLDAPGWRPIAVRPGNSTYPLVEWGWFGDTAPRAPFFEEDARVARRHPLTRLLRPFSPLAALDTSRTRLPDALILHVSRCGSTLLAQLLATLPGAFVLSEPPPLDAIFAAQDAALLGTMARALGPDDSHDGPYVIKLDCWHACFPALLDAAFPAIPRIILIRDPVEVVVSHRRSRGMQTVAGTAAAATLGLTAHGQGPEEDIAMTIGQVYSALVGNLMPGRDLLLDWTALPEAVAEQILPHLGLYSTANAKAEMAIVAHRSAKAPHEIYVPDSKAKRSAASPAVIDSVERHISQSWRQLLALLD